MSKSILIQVRRDHITSLYSGTPATALEELIWNALDADARDVRIELDTNPLGAVEAIRICDNGTGIDIAHVEESFGGIGGSWKRNCGLTSGLHRTLHGRQGKGRFKAFALGAHVEWRTTIDIGSGLKSFAISGDSEDPSRFELEELREPGPACGTEVLITNIKPAADSLTEAGTTVQTLASRFALYLQSYPDVKILFGGIPVTPVIVQEDSSDYDIAIENLPPAKLRIIRWRRKMAGSGHLIFCGPDGFALHDIPSGVRPGALYPFTAYIVSDRFPELAAMNTLVMDELHPEVRAYIAAARKAVRNHFRALCLDEGASRIEAWIRDGSYPFNPKDASPQRAAFDEAANILRARIEDFDSMSTADRGLILRLLKAALENEPLNNLFWAKS